MNTQSWGKLGVDWKLISVYEELERGVEVNVIKVYCIEHTNI